MRRTRPARRALVTAPTLFTPLTPLALSGQAAAAGRPLQSVADPRLEQGSANWTFIPGTGVATNIPHGVAKLIYLNVGAGRQVSQTATAGGQDIHDFSAWIATSGTGARPVVGGNGTTQDRSTCRAARPMPATRLAGCH